MSLRLVLPASGSEAWAPRLGLRGLGSTRPRTPPGLGLHQASGSRPRAPGLGLLASGSWPRTPGLRPQASSSQPLALDLGLLALGSWPQTPGLRLLALDSWARTHALGLTPSLGLQASSPSSISPTLDSELVSVSEPYPKSLNPQ
jgi:hypothetical protein